jgi:hypothetical protein
MTKTETLLADLEHASKIAKAGENTPLVGGPIGLMWGVLTTAVLGLHYMIVTQTIALPYSALNFLWIGFAVLGGLGSVILGRKLDKKPGANSNANQVEQYVWMMFTAAMASLAVGVILNLILGKGGYDLWAFILIAGFAGQGLAYGVVAKLTGHRWVHFAAFAGFTMAAVTISFYGQNIIYLIAALGTIATVVIPSLLSMKAAR